MNGEVAMSDDFALGWHEPVDSKVDTGYTIAVWGDHVLVGGEDGDVSYSDDGGATFTALEDVRHSGDVTVAFDSYFPENDTIYAAIANGNDDDNGVYRFMIGEDEEWTDLKAEPTKYGLCCSNDPNEGEPFEVHFTGIVLDTDEGNPMTSAATGGVLYASYQSEDPDITGVARYLTPAEDVVCKPCGDWDYLWKGLPDHDPEGCPPDIGPSFETIPDALKICGCLSPDTNSKLFAVDYDDWGYDMWHPLGDDDNFDSGLWMFEDCYAKQAPDLVTQDGYEVGVQCDWCDSLPFVLKWDRLCDACSYEVQIALDSEFTEIVWSTTEDVIDTDHEKSYVPPDGDAPAVHVTSSLIPDNIYYWRVRAVDAGTGQYIRSWWSDYRSIRVAPWMGSGVMLVYPVSDSDPTPVSNLQFEWTMLADADQFEWTLRQGTAVVSSATKTTTNHICAVELDYDTPYTWEVVATRNGDTISTAEASFRTMVEVPPDPDPEPDVTPVWVWVVIAIGAVLVIVVIILIFRTRRV
jgi:hypothetical protein